MRGNPVAYKNLYRHLHELLSYVEISLDSDFVLEELNNAQYECETTFGKRHPFTLQIKEQMKYLYKKYINKKALPLSNEDGKRLKRKIQEWLIKYYRQPP